LTASKQKSEHWETEQTANEMKTRKLAIAAATLAALTLTASAQSWLTNGLVAYYPFNGNANDTSGNGHNGTANGATLTTDRFGMTNAAYHFTSGQYIDIPLDCSSQKPLSYSFWVQQDTTVQTLAQSLIWTGTFDAPSHNVGINGTNNLYAEFYPRGVYHSGSKFVPERWTHVVVTWSDTMMLYVNGITVGEAEYPSTPAFRSAVTRLGRSQDFYINPLEGTMDDVRIYNRVLSQDEVEQLFALESGPRVDLIKALKPAFSSLWIGTKYQLQLSGDMNTWTNHGASFTATNTSLDYPQYWDVESWGSLFFRLQTVP
jgi:hypothetical protein